MQKSANCVDMPLLWKPNRKLPARIADKTFENSLEHRRVQVKVKVVDKKLLQEAFTSVQTAFMLHTSLQETLNL